MELADAHGLRVALDHARLLVHQVVGRHDEHHLLAALVELELCTVDLLLLKLVRGQLDQGLVLLPEEALDQHQRDVGLACTCLDEDDRAEVGKGGVAL